MKGIAKAYLKGLHVSPRKTRLLVDLIRGRKVDAALTQLAFSGKQVSRPLVKLLNSAIANAVNNHDMKRDTLVISEAYVDGGPVLHRWMPRAFGRATPLKKRSSHVTLMLSGDIEEKKKEKKAVEE